MKVKGIIMTPESVRAILEGRKTQTRRVIKPQPAWFDVITEDQAHSRAMSGFDPYGFRINTPTQSQAIEKAPHKPGDVLYVKETWRLVNFEFIDDDVSASVQYKDMTIGPRLHHLKYSMGEKIGWCPSFYMPRAATRIFLRVTDVRAERVQSIERHRKLWNKINGKRDGGQYAWERNPWVWVYEFEKISREEAECAVEN